ncbi:hypothetical protein Poly30_03210 [Planctomycetes bacterium Poly30]|uniref:Uncharacterized protein n=1 Tax=Saltatorellus ferox TaxID=2528018 RepID=A0A518EL59_9BACT|nr:hypothetical protein Poly30_03210 [Planctomycetes bacterium Poly30]
MVSTRILSAGFAVALAATTLSSPVLAQDAFEPNDDCVAPPLITIGTTGSLTAGPDDDYFAVAIPANADVTINAMDGAGNSLDVELWESGCGSSLASATAAPLSYFDCGGTAREVIVQVKGAGLTDEPYTLEVAAAEIVDDMLEDNDTCSSGSLVALQSFTMPGLVVTGCDEDYYVGRLQNAGVEIQIDVLFSHAQGDLDIELWNLGCTTLLASSTSVTDNESLRYMNTTAPSMPEAIVVRVFMKNGEGFADYSLTACFGNNVLPTIGNQVCSAVPNSTARPATLCARGSDVATDNGVFLYVVDLPTSSVGYFITSPVFKLALNPGGSLGNLCLDVPGRYNYDALFTGGGNAVFYQPDLTNTPIGGGGFGAVMAGETRLWQLWHRDSVGGMAVSNFSTALGITFQ